MVIFKKPLSKTHKNVRNSQKIEISPYINVFSLEIRSFMNRVYSEGIFFFFSAGNLVINLNIRVLTFLKIWFKISVFDFEGELEEDLFQWMNSKFFFGMHVKCCCVLSLR